jgi:hypothetical protein
MERGAPARQRATSGPPTFDVEPTRTQPVTLSSTSRDNIQNVQTAPTTSDVPLSTPTQPNVPIQPLQAQYSFLPQHVSPQRHQQSPPQQTATIEPLVA